jgi:Fe2+ transport system protein FeoA
VIAEVEVAQADLQRLEVMGICPGRFVKVIKPGDPLVVRVLGTRIGLAAALAAFVYVSPCEAR